MNRNNLDAVYGREVVPQLTIEERDKLQRVMTGHGKRKAASEGTGRSHTTLYSAIAGKVMDEDVVLDIRNYLAQFND